MGVLGTGVAAGVAQTALQSQEVARRRDKRRSEASRTADRVREVLEVRLMGLEEDDAAEDATRLHIDNQLPDHDRHALVRELHEQAEDADEAAPPSADDDAAPPATYAPPTANADEPAPLYRHLDVEA